jgi:hypothetical protein
VQEGARTEPVAWERVVEHPRAAGVAARQPEALHCLVVAGLAGLQLMEVIVHDEEQPGVLVLALVFSG